MKETLYGADLFCGAGGFTTGLMNAVNELGLDVQLLAINHWDMAIATHSANHPGVQHFCESLDGVDPRKVVPGGRLHILMASPECTHHSRARGGKPMSDQSRSTAWHILRWAEALYIDNILIENVREFRDWGPLGSNGRPLKSMQGRLYRQFISSLRALGYTVEDRILNAADYGDATTRQRLFIRAQRGRKRIVWPSPTHLPPNTLDLSSAGQTWKPAREIIDWSIPGQSIYNRKRPLSPNTMKRIMTGLQKYSGLPTLARHDENTMLKPYLVVLRNNCDGKPIDAPVPALCASGQHIGIAEPFLVKSYLGSDACSLDKPLPTITANYEHLGLASPCIVNNKGQSIGRSVDNPVPTITAGARHLGVAEPFLVKYYGNEDGAYSVDSPLGTITGKDRFALVSPAIIDQINEGDIVGWLDIRFRMLQPHELAAAMSFPDDYTFAGTREHQVKQIGNAVPVRLAKALCKSILMN